MASIPPTLCTISHTNAQPFSPHKSACGRFGLSGTILASEVQRSESKRRFELLLFVSSMNELEVLAMRVLFCVQLRVNKSEDIKG